MGNREVAALGFAKGVALATMCMVLTAAAKSPPPPPPELSWAYPVAPRNTPELKAPLGIYSTPDGRRKLTAAEIEHLTPQDEDWFPGSHPTPPDVILKSQKNAAPCAECHMVNGQGVVGVPDIAGLPAPYILEQVNAFRKGTRTSAQPGRIATQAMIGVAKAWSMQDVKAAAAYYAGLPRRTPTRVLESEVAPPMKMERWGWTYLNPAGGQPHPLNGGVAEAPESVPEVFMGDLSNRQVVYVSKGTLAAGEALVRSGGGGQPCTLCHGSDLRGTAVAPPLAGRDPGYLARQLWDIQSGARSGAAVAAMQAPARGLSPHDITAIAAYLASKAP